MPDFWVFLAKVPLAFMAVLLATGVLAYLTATPDLQMQLAALIGGE